MSTIAANAPAYRFSSLRTELSAPMQTTTPNEVNARGRLDLPAPAGFGTPDTYEDNYKLAKPPQGLWSGMNSIRGGSSGGAWDNLGQASSRMGGIVHETPGPGGPAADAQTRMGVVIHERAVQQQSGELSMRLENQQPQFAPNAGPAPQTRMIKEVELSGAGAPDARRPQGHRATSEVPMNPGVIRDVNPQPDPPGKDSSHPLEERGMFVNGRPFELPHDVRRPGVDPRPPGVVDG